MLAGYRHGIRQQNDPVCLGCGAGAETLGDLLTDCPAREDLKGQVETIRL